MTKSSGPLPGPARSRPRRSDQIAVQADEFDPVLLADIPAGTNHVGMSAFALVVADLRVIPRRGQGLTEARPARGVSSCSGNSRQRPPGPTPIYLVDGAGNLDSPVP